jgi:glyoxylase-like metal-dependent hydrolase (beta-lactamase superfamily II)
VLGALARLGGRVAAILVTHTDVDHIAGVAELAERTGAEVWGPAGEIDALRDGRSRTGNPVRPHDAEHAVRGGDTMAAAGTAFEVVDVPGHSAGHVAFAADGAVFSGDLLFAGSVGRVDLPGGDGPTLLRSIRGLLDSHSPETGVYPGHMGVTTLGAERAGNPFLAELAR